MGAAMIREGITADACADSATAHWSEDAREEVGIQKVNVADIIPAPAGRHPAAGYVAKLMRARIPIMLHGGAGVGKTTLARDAAEMFDLPFGMLSMTAGLSTTALTGSVNLQGFVSRPCVDTFSDGGVFLFDEMDAADPNLLLICNTMLANGEFHSPVTGERLQRHTHWFPFAAVNTLNGASTAYTGRTRLDHATMDRWRMGRIRMEFNLDLALEFATKELTSV
jgi:MoxR-like ATPase